MTTPTRSIASEDAPASGLRDAPTSIWRRRSHRIVQGCITDGIRLEVNYIPGKGLLATDPTR
jgi:hypothetical protein